MQSRFEKDLEVEKTCTEKNITNVHWPDTVLCMDKNN